jgi:predicted phage terminase large subunit-like protein
MTPEAVLQAAASDPAVFISLCLGKPCSRLQHDLVSHAMSHLSWYEEVPRGHTKTSTFACLSAWWLGNRPSTRFKVVSQTDEHGGATSKYVREIVKSKVFRAVFPHVRLKAGEDRTTAWSVTSPGIAPRRDPSMQGSGVFGRTGGRADVIWFDDICDLRNSVLQPTLRSQVKEAVVNIWMPMLDPSGDYEPRVWRTATPFHTDDQTADWRRNHALDGSLLRLPCVGTQSPWPEVFTPEVLETRKTEMGPMAYARAYELVPLSSDLLVFKPDWIGHYPSATVPKPSRTVAALDWGYGRKEQGRSDPDYSVCIVGQIDFQRHLFLTDVLRVREPFPVFARMAAELLDRRGASVVLAEANGPQKGIFDQFQTMTSLPMVAVERAADKHIRAAAAQPFVSQGRLRFPVDGEGRVLPSFQTVIDEMMAFPAGAHDDTVDAVVDLCMEAVRGSLGRGDRDVPRFERPDAISRMFKASAPRRPFFA